MRENGYLRREMEAKDGKIVKDKRGTEVVKINVETGRESKPKELRRENGNYSEKTLPRVEEIVNK